MADVTAVIITKNEERNLEDCLKSIITFAKRILVIDSGSIDRTQEIAEKYGAEFYFHEFETHARQRNWAIENLNITTKWILRIDADERLTPNLCEELESVMQEHAEDNVDGIAAEAWLFFMGRKLKHGGSRKKKVILFKTGKGAIEDRKMDEHTILYNGVSTEVKEKFLHYDFKNLNEYVKKLNWYAIRELQDYIEVKEGINQDLDNPEIRKIRRKKFGLYYKFPKFLRCWLYFFFVYFFKGNFLNGKEGFVYSFLYHCYYRMLVDAKILEYEKNPQEFEALTSL